MSFMPQIIHQMTALIMPAMMPTTGPNLTSPLWQVMLPELILVTVACFLFLLGVSNKPAMRRLAPMLALAALAYVFVQQLWTRPPDTGLMDAFQTLRIFHFAFYIKTIAAGVGMILVLMAWPTNNDGTGNSAMNFGQESGEFFALMLLSIAGVFLVAGADDIILLFLGIELAAIPTYIMVSISRPLPVAQEAGVKYFFLGALAAALLLLGFSYLYGTTGSTSLSEIMVRLHAPQGAENPATLPSTTLPSLIATQQQITPNYFVAAPLSTWAMLGIVMLIAGFAFKMAAVPLHFYAGDVYQGAATPVTAFLSFIPKTSGFVALIKILFVICGPQWIAPAAIIRLLWVLAIMTMFVGNVLGLLQHNIKRLLAYSSIAHSGYMLVGITALLAGDAHTLLTNRLLGLEAVLFYLAVYGVMNAAAFAVLMLLPAGEVEHHPQPATSAETFEDIAGQGRNHLALGLAMAVACFSLIGLPLTAGFFGKFVIIRAAWVNANDSNHLTALVIITMVNAAISAAYYLRIVGAMFLRPRPGTQYGHGSASAAGHTATHASTPASEFPTIEQTERAMEQGTFAAQPGIKPLVSPIADTVRVHPPGRLTHAPIILALCLSVFGSLTLGIFFPGTEALMRQARSATAIEPATPAPPQLQLVRPGAAAISAPAMLSGDRDPDPRQYPLLVPNARPD